MKQVKTVTIGNGTFAIPATSKVEQVVAVLLGLTPVETKWGDSYRDNVPYVKATAELTLGVQMVAESEEEAAALVAVKNQQRAEANAAAEAAKA
jgi:hypothetical protein